MNEQNNQWINDDPVIGPNNEQMQLYEDYQKIKNDYLYLGAEFENYKKRIIKQQNNERIYQDEHLLTILIPALINLYYGSVSDDNCKVIFNSFKQELKKAEIEIYIPQIGQKFSEDKMQAININTECTEEENGKVHKCICPGFILKDKIIQYAKVIVNKK